MNAIDLKRVEYRHYLEASGVMDALSYALIKLYDEVEKPSDAVAFVRQHFKRPTDEHEYTDSQKRIEDMDASEMIKKQEHELNLARLEIAKLQQMLDTMSSKSPLAEHVDSANKPSTYDEIFNDSKYDETLIKKYLTEELFAKLHKLSDEPSIIDCIANVDALQANPFGVIVSNGNCYSTFADLFEPIIKDVHCIDGFGKYPECNWGDVDFVFEKIENDAIVSTEISCCRSLANVPFIPGISEHQLETILTTVQNAIQSNQTDDKEIDAEFYKISDVKENEPIFGELQANGIGFRSMKPDQHTLWPIGRAIYINNGARTQSILINEQEHLRFISKEMNGDFGVVYKNLIELIGKYGNGLAFERHERYGWLTTNLELLGTGLRCTVCLKLKQSADCIRDVCEKSRIKITPIRVTEQNEHIIELKNRNAFGMTEFECVKAFYDSVKGIMQTLVECGLQSDVQNGMQIEMRETQKGTTNDNETNVEAETQSNSPKLCENPSEGDKNEGDKRVGNEQSPAVGDDTTKNAENNEQPKGDEDNVQNEPVSNTQEGNLENASNEENAANPHEPSENDTDNLDKGEKVNEDAVKGTNQNAETIECEANQNENETDQNQNEINSERPDEVEDQSTTAPAASAEEATSAAVATEEGAAAASDQPAEA